MKKFFALLIVAAMVFTLVACGSSKYVGKYKADIMGMTIELELKSGGKAVATIEGEESNFEWSSKDKTITLKDSDTTTDGTVSDDGKTITFSDFGGMGVEVVFEKAD
ncbi:MAG: hypothetical protein IJQ80_04320 [Clostridia bacterium]|nr:hypothetical protein [Clostridia bacterium]